MVGSLRRVALLIFTVALVAPAAHAVPQPTVDLQLVNFSDWHGQLDPISSGGTLVGGAAHLSSYFKRERLANPNTLTLTAGDEFNASLPLSSFFEEEPAVMALNLMGLDVGTLGNHNFDRGLGHLQRMIDLADYSVVSANLSGVEGNLTDVAPWTMRTIGGIDVGIVGITNPDAPSLLFPGQMGGITVTDPVPAANRARARALAAGAEVTIVISHLGITGFHPDTGEPYGPLIDFAADVGGFDVVFGDHTDVRWSGMVGDRFVVQNKSRGATYSRTLLRVNPLSGRLVERRNSFVVPVISGVSPDPVVVEMLRPYRTALSRVYDTKIAVASDVFPRAGNIERLGEVALGNLVADAMRLRYGTQLAIANGGGLRQPIPSSYAPADTTLRRTAPGYAAGPPYDVVIGDVYAVLPFGNAVVTRTVTGALLRRVLNHGIAVLPGASGRFPQISGFRFSYHPTTPPVVAGIWLEDGTPVTDGAVYTLALPDFINAGGDSYVMLADGAGTTRELMAQVLQHHIESEGEITPSVEGRITRIS